MTALDRAILTINGSLGDGPAEFHFAGNLTVTPGVRTGYLIGGQGSSVNAILGDVTGTGGGERDGVFIDLGGGARSVDVEFRGWEGSTDGQGNVYRWGDTGDPDTVTGSDATGAPPMTQLEVLFEYMATTNIDSNNPATLSYGEHHNQGGLYDPLEVVIEQPNLSKAAEDGTWFDGTITFLSAADLNERIDSLVRGGQ